MKKLLAFLCFLLTLSCAKDVKYYESFGVNHTFYKITYEYNKPLDTEIKDIIKKYYHSLNPFDPTSVISHVNNNKKIDLDSIFINTLSKSLYISDITGGYFDVTCAPILNHWGFGFENNPEIRTKDIAIDVDSILEFVGYQKISLINNELIKSDPRIIVSFSGVGDGCVCDMIGDFFDKIGVMNYMIDVGGEVLVKGKNPKNEEWSIGIRKPDDNINSLSMIQLIKTDQRLAIATSGDYLNYYIKNGKKYAHTINPKTGYPADQDILSATVVYKECLIADGIATAIMTMGRDEFEKYKEALSFVDYLIIFSDENGKYSMESSPGMELLLKKDNLSVLYEAIAD